jgi:MFS family permease
MKLSKKTLTIILIGLAVADLLGAIDSTGVNIALPTITKDLAIPIVVSQWIPNAYTLVLVGTLIFMGKIGDTIGQKKLYLIGLALFGAASLALGLVNQPTALIVIRAIQGLGTAILYTMPMAIIAHLWEEREKAFAVTASFFAAGMLAGPLVGGFLTSLNIGSFHGWHLIFLLNVPLIIAGGYIAAKFIPNVMIKEKSQIDYLSMFLLLAGLALIVLSLTMISSYYFFVGLLILLALYLYEKRIKNPLLELSLFRNQTFTASNIVSAVAMISIIGMSFVLTFYFQDILKWSSLQAGLALLPIPLVTGIVAALSSKLKNWRLSAFLTSGLILAGLALLTQVTPTIPYTQLILPALILIAAGGGVLMTVMFSAIIGSAPTDKSGSASGFLNTLQQLGGLIGIAIVAGIVLNYHQSFQILTYISLFAVVAAFFVRDGTAKIER